MHQRAHDDGNLSFEELRKRQLAVVEYCVLLFVLFKDRYLRKKKVQHSFEPRGHLTIKLIEACPYISYERYDFDIHWGLYLSGTPGMDSPCFLTSSDDGELYEKLKDHFKYLLDNEYEKATSLDIEKHNILLQITYQKPWLNEELAAHFIGLDRLEELKSQTPEKIINNLNNILEI